MLDLIEKFMIGEFAVLLDKSDSDTIYQFWQIIKDKGIVDWAHGYQEGKEDTALTYLLSKTSGPHHFMTSGGTLTGCMSGYKSMPVKEFIDAVSYEKVEELDEVVYITVLTEK